MPILDKAWSLLSTSKTINVISNAIVGQTHTIDQEVLGTKLGSIVKLGNESASTTTNDDKFVGQVGGGSWERVAGVIDNRSIGRGGVETEASGDWERLDTLVNDFTTIRDNGFLDSCDGAGAILDKNSGYFYGVDLLVYAAD